MSQDRRASVVALKKRGLTYQQIGELLNVSRQRAEQLFKGKLYSRKLGVVYFIRGGGLIKIGWTADLARRLEVLRSQSPVELKLIGTVEGSRAKEKELHNKFSEYHVHHEWYESAPVTGLLHTVVGFKPLLDGCD